MAQDFTVDRYSSKWVLGDAGVLVEYDNDEPAIEFNADGSYKGVLVEPANTNEAVNNEDLDNATYWQTTRTTIAGDTETDPKGGTNSFLLSETTVNGDHFLINEGAYRPTITSGETWTQSVYLKKGTGANAPDIMQLTFSASTHGATQHANFNISTGVVAKSSGGTATIQDAGNGWYRCAFTSTATSTSAVGIVRVGFTNNDNSLGRAPSYAGQTDADVFVWGAQLEKSPIATSYIPTTTIPVTRVKDDIYITGASSLIGQTEGTLFFEVDWRLSSGLRQYLVDINSSITNNDRIYIRTDDNDFIRFQVDTNSGGGRVFDTTESADLSGIYKIAFAYKSTDSKIAINGTSIDPSSDFSFSFTNNLSDINLGQNYVETQQANMHIRTVALYKTRLSDAECEALTT